MSAAARAIVATVLAAASCALVTPSPSALRARASFVDAPFDPALRVPETAALLGSAASSAVRGGDRVLEVAVVPAVRPFVPRDRSDLYRAVRDASPRELRVQVVRDGARFALDVPVVSERGIDRLARAWPLALVAAAFLCFGLGVAAGSAHPSAVPLAAVSWCLGSALLGELDRVWPELPGAFAPAEARARLAVLGWGVLPAALLHLAMRFPVVSVRLRGARAAALPYALWLPPTAIAQLRLHDAAFHAVLERIAIGASVAAALLLAVACATAARRLTAIERGRTGALIAGLGAGSSGPAALFASGGSAPAELLLTLLALPGALAWAIVRFRMLDPTLRLQRALVGGTTGLAALLLAAGGAAAVASLLGVGSEEMRLALLLGVAAATGAHLLQALLRRSVRLRVLSEREQGQLLERAVRELAESRTPAEVLERAAACVCEALGAPVMALSLDGGTASGGKPLAASGLVLWQTAGAPEGAVLRGRRDADPSPERAELVVALRAGAAPTALLAVGGRASDLPYTAGEERLLEALGYVAATALAAAAATSDLDARVREKTADLARGLRDRQRVLEAAEGICAAENEADVLLLLERFAGEGLDVRWLSAKAPPGSALCGRVQAPGAPVRTLRVEGIAPARRRELAPQLDTLCAFAGIALARLALLLELKREVERQAAELGEIRSRRLHAEFVRDVAHELRKPLDELRQRVDSLPDVPPVAAARGRLRKVGRELSRRLDLLLFHSGVRLDRRRTDLARLVDEAVGAARAVNPDRDFCVCHELPMLPVLGDPSRLLSVMENLLDNAVKATEPGQRILLRSRLERLGAGGRPSAVVEVEDEGAGVDAESAARIFEPGVSFAPGGFGLGLSLCREIVCLHGGTIELESRPGRTLFRVRIPLFASAVEADGG